MGLPAPRTYKADVSIFVAGSFIVRWVREVLQCCLLNIGLQVVAQQQHCLSKGNRAANVRPIVAEGSRQAADSDVDMTVSRYSSLSA